MESRTKLKMDSTQPRIVGLASPPPPVEVPQALHTVALRREREIKSKKSADSIRRIIKHAWPESLTPELSLD
jgi:hypothetical protein